MSSEYEDLLATLAGVIGEEAPEHIRKNLRDEQITTKARFLLLDGNDLKELGFALGPRKQLMMWLARERDDGGDEVRSEASSSSQRSTSSHPSTPSAASSSSRRKFQNFHVENLLQGKKTEKFDGEVISTRLKDGIIYTPKERSFLTKTVCTYLMENCERKNDPTMEEKVDMAQSITTCFPVLKDPVTGGYGEFCDPKSHSGYINYYVRKVRSRSSEIQTRWTHQRKRKMDTSVEIDDDEADVRNLRERRPNASNRVELLEMMDRTRAERRHWIKSKAPTITEILQKYPRFQDIDEALKEEFTCVVKDSSSLMVNVAPLKPKILSVAKGHLLAAPLVSQLDTDAAEDTKSEVAFKCLVAMLRPPPQKKVTGPLPSVTTSIGYFFNDCQDCTVEEAVERLRTDGCRQPCLFRIGDKFYLKVDNSAIPLPNASCFTEAVEFLVMAFYVFHVEYPAPLRAFYACLERLMGVGGKQNSSVLRDFFRALDAAQ